MHTCHRLSDMMRQPELALPFVSASAPGPRHSAAFSADQHIHKAQSWTLQQYDVAYDRAASCSFIVLTILLGCGLHAIRVAKLGSHARSDAPCA